MNEQAERYLRQEFKRWEVLTGLPPFKRKVVVVACTPVNADDRPRDWPSVLLAHQASTTSGETSFAAWTYPGGGLRLAPNCPVNSRRPMILKEVARRLRRLDSKDLPQLAILFDYPCSTARGFPLIEIIRYGCEAVTHTSEKLGEMGLDSVEVSGIVHHRGGTQQHTYALSVEAFRSRSWGSSSG